MKARWINSCGGGSTSAPARDAAALHCKTLRALPVILGNCVIIGGIVLATLTARDNIFSAPTERYIHPKAEAIEQAFAKLKDSQKVVTAGCHRENELTAR